MSELQGVDAWKKETNIPKTAFISFALGTIKCFDTNFLFPVSCSNDSARCRLMVAPHKASCTALVVSTRSMENSL